MVSAGRAPMRPFRVKGAVTLLVLGAVLASAIPLQWIWWQTARQSSLELVDILSEQISVSVRRTWWERVLAAEAAFGVAQTLITAPFDGETPARALTAALAASNVPSAIAFDGAETGRWIAHRLQDGVMRVDRVAQAAETSGIGRTAQWTDMPASPTDGQKAIVYTGTLGTQGILSVYIGLERFAELLGSITVGRRGGAFVIDPIGTVKIAPISSTGRTFEHLLPVALAAAAVVAARPAGELNIIEARRLVVEGSAYRVALSPLEFSGWQFAVVVPEADFLSSIEETNLRAAGGLLGLALALGFLAALLAQRVLADPFTHIAKDLKHIERFELDQVKYKAGRLMEFDQLSAAMDRMAAGLSDFAKFIPTDLVRTLLADGVRAEPGGETRNLTLIFADVAGFTSISERMGTDVIDVISRYLDVVSGSIASNGGTVDKFIGDAVMAFWGAPRHDDQQATRACQAALDALAAVRDANIRDDLGAPIQMRIGIHTGAAVVGNIGSNRRLNYTAIGDTVNLASRLEGVNKVFGTSVLMSDVTRRAAGEGFSTREIAEVSVVGKARPVIIHELIGPATAGMPEWATAYGKALFAYRQRDFSAALDHLNRVVELVPDDGPAHWLADVCRKLLVAPPSAEWRGVVVLDAK